MDAAGSVLFAHATLGQTLCTDISLDGITTVNPVPFTRIRSSSICMNGSVGAEGTLAAYTLCPYPPTVPWLVVLLANTPHMAAACRSNSGDVAVVGSKGHAAP